MSQNDDNEYPKLIKYEYKHQPDFSSLPQFLVLSVISNPFCKYRNIHHTGNFFYKKLYTSY